MWLLVLLNYWPDVKPAKKSTHFFLDRARLSLRGREEETATVNRIQFPLSKLKTCHDYFIIRDLGRCYFPWFPFRASWCSFYRWHNEQYVFVAGFVVTRQWLLKKTVFMHDCWNTTSCCKFTQLFVWTQSTQPLHTHLEESISTIALSIIMWFWHKGQGSWVNPTSAIFLFKEILWGGL
jgi:hypothetical protein